MNRHRKNPQSFTASALPQPLLLLAQVIGDALSQSVARVLIEKGYVSMNHPAAAPVGRRGRPPAPMTGGPALEERRCTVPGCEREFRSRGLCSAHYQSDRRRRLAAQAAMN